MFFPGVDDEAVDGVPFLVGRQEIEVVVEGAVRLG